MGTNEQTWWIQSTRPSGQDPDMSILRIARLSEINEPNSPNSLGARWVTDVWQDSVATIQQALAEYWDEWHDGPRVRDHGAQDVVDEYAGIDGWSTISTWSRSQRLAVGAEMLPIDAWIVTPDDLTYWGRRGDNGTTLDIAHVISDRLRDAEFRIWTEAIDYVVALVSGVHGFDDPRVAPIVSEIEQMAGVV